MKKPGMWALALSGVAVTAAGFSFSINQTQAPARTTGDLRQMLSTMDSNFNLFNQAWAEEMGSAECSAIMTKASEDYPSGYVHGALMYFNSMLFMMNKMVPAIAEVNLCHFAKSMGINPDKSALPVSVSKTFNGKTVNVEVVAPTESFASALGYDAKATVTLDGVNWMVMYWGGTGTQSSGFLIQGPGGLSSGGKSPMYVQWSRKDDNNQFVKVLSSQFSGSHLSAINGSEGDSAMYGRASFNKSTSVLNVQMVLLEGERAGTASNPACFKMMAEGTKGGTVSVIKTDNSLGSTGHVETDTSKVVTFETDAFQGIDSISTANGTGNTTTAATGITTAFDKSCNDVYAAGGAGQPFAGDTVDFAVAPSTVFPN